MNSSITDKKSQVTRDYFEKLKVWQKSHELVLEVYETIDSFPKSERFGLIDQIKRAVTSIPNNIAEGTGRNTSKELLRFLYVARGSLEEIKYLLILSRDLGYIEEDLYSNLKKDANIVGKLLNGFINSVKKDNE
ncbi:four helix bundle protein [Natroniella sulfidigena]|uniref:four helix bundle protein n=1 Tax=Natroniella sulfidigena TaxID=723921 RepID=UPI00200AFDE6|nr:four helix bundle protein [Natroniella sulfidigena]MCK8816014.1 four helix bundle protein [Natroniella sulfidigena]